MELYQYLWENQILKKDFSKIINVTPQYLSLVTNYKKVPGFKLAFKIEEVTNGKVKAREILQKCMDYQLKKIKDGK